MHHCRVAWLREGKTTNLEDRTLDKTPSTWCRSSSRSKGQSLRYSTPAYSRGGAYKTDQIKIDISFPALMCFHDDDRPLLVGRDTEEELQLAGRVPK